LNKLTSNDIYPGQELLVSRAGAQTATPANSTITPALDTPTITATRPVLVATTSTSTPEPSPPASAQSSSMVVLVIVAGALLTAGIGTWLSMKKEV